MDLTKLKAFEVKVKVDEQSLSNELNSIPIDKWETGVDKISGTSWKTLWLTVNNTSVFNDFKSAKSITHSEWSWDTSLDIPYIKSLVSSLPVKTIGMVRAFILNGPLVMHVDSNDSTPEDLTYKLGLTIASELTDPMILDGEEIKEKHIFFDDSLKHGFPNSNGRQVSIRIFGDFEFEQFTIGKTYER